MAEETRHLQIDGSELTLLMQIDGSELTLLIKRSARRKRRLSLSLQPNGNALLQVPLRTPNSEIERMLSRHRQWLGAKHRQLQDHLQRNPPLRFVHGASLPYKGHTLRLEITVGSGASRCNLEEGVLQVGIASPQEAAVARLVQQWYRRQAELWFAERLTHWSGLLAWVEQPPPLRLRRMRSRWGSCSSTGRICLNSELIKLPLRSLDYVVVHELCHLQEFNHSPRFYALMTAAIPDWRERRRELATSVLR